MNNKFLFKGLLVFGENDHLKRKMVASRYPKILTDDHQRKFNITLHPMHSAKTVSLLQSLSGNISCH